MKLTDQYIEVLNARMEKGADEYGERSWSKDPVELCGEVMEELADVAGWAGIMWCRLERLRTALVEIRGKKPEA